MRDPADIYTRRGTPVITVVVRFLFFIYFGFAFWSVLTDQFLYSKLSLVWIFYLVGIYIMAETLYLVFGRRGIDLTFAWPLLLAVFILNLVTLILGGQDILPLLNRTEHFASFVLLGYIVWVFFLKYLPQNVWHKHPYYTAILTLAITALLGVSNEIIELFFDRLLGTSIVGDQYDTSLDLLMNTLGSGMFLAVSLIVGTLNEKNLKKFS